MIEKLDQLTDNLDYILETLSEEVPEVPIVAMNYYNPYLACYSVDPEAAGQTIMLQRLVNLTLETVWANYGGPVVDVAGAFMSYDIKTDNHENDFPDSVEWLCAWTWMCRHQNIHPHASGYATIAARFCEILPDLPVWTPAGRRKEFSGMIVNEAQ